MSNTIKIKRSTGSSAPNPNLRQGEMAYAEGSKALYIGAGTEGSAPNFSASSMHIIGGAINNLIAPTGSLSMNSQKITNLADPTSITDAANKRYVDSHVQGLDVKESVRVATTTVMPSGFPNSYGGSTSGGQNVIDGVTLADGDRVLVKSQASNDAADAANGIYTYADSSKGFSRATDFDENDEVTANAFVFVEEGTTNADNGFVLTTNNAITIGSTAIQFTQFSGAGQIVAGNGISKSGNTLNAALTTNGGLEIHNTQMRVNLGASSINGTLPTSKVTTEAIADGGANLATADQIHTFVTGSYAGDITAVSAGTGLAGGGTTGTVNLSVDLEELANGASDPVGNDKIVYVTAGGDTKKYAFSDVPLTIFDSATFIKDSSIIDCGTF